MGYIQATLSITSLFMAHSGGEVECLKTPAPISIDGQLDEAAWTAAFKESSPLQDIVVDPRAPEHSQDWYQVMPGGGNTNNGGLRVSRGQFDGDEDLLVRWATVWDQDYLYFAFDVTDDSVHIYERNYEARDGNIDGIWLLFDTSHDAPQFEFPPQEFNTAEVALQSTYAGDDHYWIFAPLTGREAGTAWSSSLSARGDPILNDPANGHVIGVVSDTGYTVEIRLPWSVFEPFFGAPLVPEHGLTIGFDITFMDIDGDPPGYYEAPFGGAMAWSSDFENDNSPGVLGDLLISGRSIGKTFKRGDANADGAIDISDAVFGLGYLFLGGPTPACLKTVDSDDSAVVDLSDSIYLLNHLFLSGPALPEPFKACGTDPTEDRLTCDSHPPCG